MAFYDGLFNGLGLKESCDANQAGSSVSMADLMAQLSGEEEKRPWWDVPFPSMDNLHEACEAIPRSRDFTEGVKDGFLYIKDGLKLILDPITQPLSWLIDGALYTVSVMPWWFIFIAIVYIAYRVSRSVPITCYVVGAMLWFLFIDYYDSTIQTLAIIFVCTFISVAIGVPIGIAMSRRDWLERMFIPLLDMLQTLPTFVYLIPLIFLFDVTESKLYGIAIILYAIVPVVRLTNLGIRLVDKDVIEAADAYGMTQRQKLFKVEIPLALPNIMAGINQTIMMSLAMVVIASLVSAPGLGVDVLRGIRALEIGPGFVAGFNIVLLAIMLDRVSKAALARIDTTQDL